MNFFIETSSAFPRPEYEYITTNARALEVLEDLESYSIIEVDTETTGLDPFVDRLALLQMGAGGKAYVFDVRSDTEHSDIDPQIFKKILMDKSILKILQNAVFDMKFIKYHWGFYIENIYDTMLVEQLFYLGISQRGASLEALVRKYLGLEMDKQPAKSFEDYNQVYEEYQLVYAATDVVVLTLIRDMQISDIEAHKLEDVCRLEFEFTKPLCEMELNGIHMDENKWRVIMEDIEKERMELGKEISSILSKTESQTSLFGVSAINIDSHEQLLKALRRFGLRLNSTSEGELKKMTGVPVIDALLRYRKTQKLISTYGESLLAKIHKASGRLHTRFRQMVSTGRMSSSNPNLQNIPNKQMFRTCFVAKEGCCLVTADMSGAELRILGNLSKDPSFIYCYANNIDLHTKTASGVFKVPMDVAAGKKYRGPAKAVGFGICYGMSKYGLAERLQISEDAAEKIILGYLNTYPMVAKFLENSGRSAVIKGYSRSISGRKRFYSLPPFHDPDRKRVVNSVERQAKNAPIQGSNADTIKQSMIYCVERLEKLDYYAKLLLTVHDEIIIETIYEKRYEVAEIVKQSLIDGFGKYFSLIPMETDALIGPAWLKESCEVRWENGKVVGKNEEGGEKCGGTEMVFIEDDKYGTKLICKKCGAFHGGV